MEYIESSAVIDEVQKHPCLYDPSDKHYRDKDYKKKVWMNAAAAILGPDNWDVMDDRDKEATISNVQKRWKGIKDSYMKSIKPAPGSNGKPRRPYMFHKRLAFFRPYFLHRDGVYIQYEESDGENSSSREESPRLETTNSQSVSSTPSVARGSKRKAVDEEESFDQEILGLLKESLKSTRRDPDEMFLLSQLPFIKQMKLETKIDFQVKFIHLVKDCFKR